MAFLVFILYRWGKSQLWKEVLNAENGALVLRIMCEQIGESNKEDVGQLLSNLPWLDAYDLRDAYMVALLVETVMGDSCLVDESALGFCAWLNHVFSNPKHLTGDQTPLSCRAWYEENDVTFQGMNGKRSSLLDFGTESDTAYSPFTTFLSLNGFHVNMVLGITDELIFPSGSIALRRVERDKWALSSQLRRSSSIRSHKSTVALMLFSFILILSLQRDLAAMQSWELLLISVSLLIFSLPVLVHSCSVIAAGTKESKFPLPFLRPTGRLEFVVSVLAIVAFLLSQSLAAVRNTSDQSDAGLVIYLSVLAMVILIFLHQALVALVHSVHAARRYGWKEAFEVTHESLKFFSKHIL
jgi:hypothetical protein